MEMNGQHGFVTLKRQVLELLRRDGPLTPEDIGTRLGMVIGPDGPALDAALRTTLWEMLKNDDIGLDPKMKLKV